MKKWLCFLFLLICFDCLKAQTTPDYHVRVSILTCAPGEELYELFGHTALRITDSVNGTDVLYNWGTFDFDTPNFYLEFLRGKLLYFVTTDNLDDFLYIYAAENRNVYEQVLNLDCSEKQQIMNAVAYNMQSNNRFYKYDFFFDNCTTRIRDIVTLNNKSVVFQKNIVAPGTTFRNLIHSYLDAGNQPWSKLGMDILLGVRTDREVTNIQAMFLPEYFMKGLDVATDEKKPLVKKTVTLLPSQKKSQYENMYNPLLITGIVCVLLFLISLSKADFAKKFTAISDALLLYITGILGLIILFMWFATDHIACSDNFNILWALPTNFFIAFFLWKRSNWLSGYFLIAAVIAGLLLISFFWLPQELNISIVPVVLLLFNRYLNLYLKFKKNKNSILATQVK